MAQWSCYPCRALRPGSQEPPTRLRELALPRASPLWAHIRCSSLFSSVNQIIRDQLQVDFGHRTLPDFCCCRGHRDLCAANSGISCKFSARRSSQQCFLQSITFSSLIHFSSLLPLGQHSLTLF